MEEKEGKCPTELGPDETEGWKIHIKGDCDKVLEDIRRNLGEYGTLYLERRLIFDEPATEATSTQPDESEVVTAQPESEEQ